MRYSRVSLSRLEWPWTLQHPLDSALEDAGRRVRIQLAASVHINAPVTVFMLSCVGTSLGTGYSISCRKWSKNCLWTRSEARNTWTLAPLWSLLLHKSNKKIRVGGYWTLFLHSRLEKNVWFLLEDLHAYLYISWRYNLGYYPLYLKRSISGTASCLRLHVEPTQSGPGDSYSSGPQLMTSFV
jgi:hypothetical protein